MNFGGKKPMPKEEKVAAPERARGGLEGITILLRKRERSSKTF